MAGSNMKLITAVLMVYLIAALAVQMAAAAEPAKAGAASAGAAPAGAAPAPAPKGDAASLVPAGFACISVMALGFFF